MKRKTLLLVVILSLLPLIDLLHSGLPITHDGPDHVIRVANFYQNLVEGNIIPRWAENVNYGFGHPFLIFFYPLPYYIASIFHFLGFNLINSTKLVFGLSFIASAVTMYLFIRELFDEHSAVIAALLYIFAPYRFVDFYVRGAIGEHLSFIFPPLILYLLLKMRTAKTATPTIFASMSFAGLILSHNATSLMFIPFVIFFAGCLILQMKQKTLYLWKVLYVIIIGFGLASFFWIPAIFEARYTLRNVVIVGGYLRNFVSPISLISGPWSYGGTGEFTVQIGMLHILSLLSIPFALLFLVKKKKNYLFALGLFAYSLLTVYIMIPESNFIWQKILLLQDFQFPWRFLTVLVFTSSIAGGMLFSFFIKRNKNIILFLFIIVLLFINKDYMHAKDYLQKPDIFFTRVQRTTTNDTGESSPIWSIRSMEYKPKDTIEVIAGNAKLEKGSRKIISHEYIITALEKSRIRENTLYFPGWHVFINDQEVPIEFQDQKNRGIITFFVGKGRQDVKVFFKETKLRQIANIFSIFSIILLVLLLFLSKTNLWRRYQ